jgi:hypothetical protein
VWTVMFACITAPFVARQSRGRGEHHAVLTPSVCTTAQIVIAISRATCTVSNFVANKGPLTSGVAVVSHAWRTVPSRFSGESVLDEAPCWSGRLATSCSGSLQMWP